MSGDQIKSDNRLIWCLNNNKLKRKKESDMQAGDADQVNSLYHLKKY